MLDNLWRHTLQWFHELPGSCFSKFVEQMNERMNYVGLSLAGYLQRRSSYFIAFCIDS